MAMSHAAASITSTSVRLHNRITNLSAFDHPAITVTLAAKTKPHILKIKTHYPHLRLISLLPHSQRCHALASFDNEVFDDDVDEDEEEAIEDEEEAIEDEEGAEDDHQEPSSAEGRRLYVGNLPYAMTSSQLSEVFNEAGRVDSVEIVYDRVTDRSRGFAFVMMGSVEEAKEAIRMFDGSLVGGRNVKVNFPEVPRGGEREVMGPKIRSNYRNFIETPHKIYAGNLGWSLTSEGLRDTFADQPGLLSAKVIYDRDSGRSRGFGFVSFASAEEAQSALNALNGVEVEGRPLRLNLAAQRATSASPETEQKTETEVHGSEMQSSISTY